ncbi:hypothetical protein BBP40_009147 [Aspergillus hancockii]|nr:hypothetical protein BBP40_009147 [Aspergillus hancockii]
MFRVPDADLDLSADILTETYIRASSVQTYDSPPSLFPGRNFDFITEIQSATEHTSESWIQVSAYAINVVNVNTTSNTFDRHTVAVASFNLADPVTVRVLHPTGPVDSAVIRPVSLGIKTRLEGSTITFCLNRARDVMIELNGSKWTALHLLVNEIGPRAPTKDTDDVWYLGPRINQGSAYVRVTDGVNPRVPPGKTVYFAGTFVTFQSNFVNVSHSAVQGHGFILGLKGGYVHREHGGTIHMGRASHIRVAKVTSPRAIGFNLFAGECGNVLVSDNIALYSHRWDWYGGSKNVTTQNCVLLPDIAHAINMGTHGNSNRPETSNVTIRNIDILDHDKNQIRCQGCIAMNATDTSVFQDIRRIADVRVERITRDLLDVRVMQNAMWTTVPRRAIRNIRFINVFLNLHESKVVDPSQLLGYN